jgi:hypothetical protein
MYEMLKTLVRKEEIKWDNNSTSSTLARKTGGDRGLPLELMGKL